jgi:hypothetical protein
MEVAVTEAPTDMIDTVLRQKLGPYGYDFAKVRPELDHDGEESLFIEAVLKPKSGFISADVSGDAHRALSDTLLKNGDRRFPYLFIRHPDDEPSEPPSAPVEPSLS